jgi:hypothetical protein
MGRKATRSFSSLVLQQTTFRMSRCQDGLFKKFNPLGYYGDSPDWYDQLYRALKVRAAAACILRGESISEKAVGIARSTLKEMCRWLMSQENQVIGAEELCILVILFHAVGRGGEVSASTWDSAHWDVDREMSVLEWGELKKGLQYLMHDVSARRAPDHFENLGTWDCVKFVVETIKQGVNAEATAAWGGVDKTTQGRAKKVFLALKDAASDDDKKYFSAVQCPKEGTDRTDWLDSVEEVVSRLVQAVVTKLIRDREAFKGNILSNEDVQKELKKQKMNVSAIGGLIEKVLTSSRKTGAGQT